jgi:hypothetical protein
MRERAEAVTAESYGADARRAAPRYDNLHNHLPQPGGSRRPKGAISPKLLGPE